MNCWLGRERERLVGRWGWVGCKCVVILTLCFMLYFFVLPKEGRKVGWGN